MKPKEPIDLGEQDLFRSRLDQILDLGHAKVVLANSIDWEFLAKHCGENYADVPGHPALPTRLMAGLHILKYADDLSDEEVCAKFVENPYYQYFCGELFFRHDLPLDRSSMPPLLSYQKAGFHAIWKWLSVLLFEADFSGGRIVPLLVITDRRRV